VFACLLLLSSCLQGVDELIEGLGSSNAELRSLSVEALASALDYPEPSELIAGALHSLAVEDDESSLRAASLMALGSRGDGASVEVLSGLISALPPSEASQAIAALGATPSGRTRAWRDLMAILSEGAEGVPLDALLEVGAVSLVEGGRSTWTQLELGPLVRLYSHPDPAVRRAVLVGINGAVEVLDGAGETRAIAFLEALEESGLHSLPLLSARVELGLFLGVTERLEIDALRVADSLSESSDELSPVRALGYRGTACFIEGDYGEAVRLFIEQRDLAVAISRRALVGDANLRMRGLAARLAANAEASVVLARLADGEAAESDAILSGLRRAHAAALNSHQLSIRSGAIYSGTLNHLFSSQATPWDALNRPAVLGGLTLRAAARLQRTFLSVFAAVAPEELPGISPMLNLTMTPISKDSGRLALIEAILDAKEERLLRRWAEAVRSARSRDFAGERDLELEAELESLQRESEVLQEMRRLKGKELIYAVRPPSTVALSFAASLRGRGEVSEAKEMLEAFLGDLEKNGLLTRYLWAVEFAAQADTQLGSCLCDEDLPEEAERIFLRAVARLEDIEGLLLSRGVMPEGSPWIRNLHSAALISLAVNANVRLRDPARALEYFERAYELRQDEFATVLLACYRARSGEEVAAREALARVPPSPKLFYNLSCAHALLGDKARALSFLERELRVNHSTEGARERQRAWARDDPDLASLRDEPRFEVLTTSR
jgi:tetratricopeptide (TPR) repeat protein